MDRRRKKRRSINYIFKAEELFAKTCVQPRGRRYDPTIRKSDLILFHSPLLSFKIHCAELLIITDEHHGIKRETKRSD